MKRLQLVGYTVGRLGILEDLGKTMKCICSCGTETTLFRSNLLAGYSKSCGCFCREQTSRANRTHSQSGTRLHTIWKAMKGRCLNPNRTNYKYYGEKGIKVCERWMAFEGFIADMKDTYKEGLTLDRINPKGPYSKENCRWVTWEVQRGRIGSSTL